MKNVNPKLLVALVAVLGLALWVKLSNPHRQYSTQQFWADATVATVAEVPEKALKPGNKNGSVLMWAAMGAKDPAIITALVERGADVNESDVIFTGTPVSAAAGKSSHPAIITELARLGADVNKKVGLGDPPVAVAAEHNRTPGIIEALYEAGADLNATNHDGDIALDVAIHFNNTVVEEAILKLASQPEGEYAE